MPVQIESDLPLADEVLQAVRRAAEETLRHQQVHSAASVDILLSDDAQLQELNRAYRGIDAPTDVLSFGMDFHDPEADAPHLGTIAISLPRAQEQAAQRGHAAVAELQLLTVHGVLHLLGHDHAEETEKARMWQAQTEVLRRLGLEEIRIPE